MSNEEIPLNSSAEMNDKFKYWLVAFYGDIDEPNIVHLTGYTDPITEEHAKLLFHEIMTVPEFHVPEEHVEDLKIAEIPDETARQIIDLNKDLLSQYHEQGVDEKLEENDNSSE